MALHYDEYLGVLPEHVAVISPSKQPRVGIVDRDRYYCLSPQCEVTYLRLSLTAQNASPITFIVVMYVQAAEGHHDHEFRSGEYLGSLQSCSNVPPTSFRELKI